MKRFQTASKVAILRCDDHGREMVRPNTTFSFSLASCLIDGSNRRLNEMNEDIALGTFTRRCRGLPHMIVA